MTISRAYLAVRVTGYRRAIASRGNAIAGSRWVFSVGCHAKELSPDNVPSTLKNSITGSRRTSSAGGLIIVGGHHTRRDGVLGTRSAPAVSGDAILNGRCAAATGRSHVATGHGNASIGGRRLVQGASLDNVPDALKDGVPLATDLRPQQLQHKHTHTQTRGEE